MKKDDAFTSCKVVDGIESVQYVRKKDVRQHLLKLNNVQISSLVNKHPWVLKEHAEELASTANINF